MKTTTLTIALTLAACTALAAQQPAPRAPQAPAAVPAAPAPTRAMEMEHARADMMRAGDPLERNLFPPELIMRRQREIGLQPEQRRRITQIIGRLEAALVELQWNMQDQQQALAEALQRPQVNVDSAMVLLDQVLTTEAAVKRTHFQSLLQIRAVLTPEQQQRLRYGLQNAEEVGRER